MTGRLNIELGKLGPDCHYILTAGFCGLFSCATSAAHMVNSGSLDTACGVALAYDVIAYDVAHMSGGYLYTCFSLIAILGNCVKVVSINT